MHPRAAVLYTGRGTSQFCLAETGKVLDRLDIPTTLISDINQLGELVPEPYCGTVLGKFYSPFCRVFQLWILIRILF
jgi:hypothetical protein